MSREIEHINTQPIYLSTSASLETAFRVVANGAASRSQFELVRENFIAFGTNPDDEYVPCHRQSLIQALSRIEKRFGIVEAADCALGLMELINGDVEKWMGMWVLDQIAAVLMLSPRKAANATLMVLLNAEDGSEHRQRAAQQALDLLLDERLANDTKVVAHTLAHLEGEAEPDTPFHHALGTVKRHLMGFPCSRPDANGNLRPIQ